MKSQPLILHIEQERQLRLNFSTELGKHGYVIHSVPSIEAAQAVLSTDIEIYAAIIGAYRDQPAALEFAVKIIKTRPEIRTVITTKSEGYTNLVGYLKVSAWLFMPYTLTDLINAISGSAVTEAEQCSSR